MLKELRFLFSFCLFLGTFLLLSAQNPRDPMDTGGKMMPEQAAYDVNHYALDLEVIPEQKAILGSNTISFTIVQPTQFIVLDLDDFLAVGTVTMLRKGKKKGKKLKFEQKGGQFRVDLKTEQLVGTELKIKVEYGGVPRPAIKAPWEGGFSWDKTPDGSPWIGVSCQVNGADLWYPCKDHQFDEPDSMSIWITVPKGLTAISNGLLRAEKALGDKTQFRWATSYPINNYGATINIGKYELFEVYYNNISGGSFPLQFYKISGSQQDGQTVLNQLHQAVAFLEPRVGPYPFQKEKCAIVNAPYIGMEHQTVLSLGTKVKANSGGYNYVLFHELAHEWFGNQLTAQSWGHFWLHEGLATYFEILYHEFKQTQNTYRNRVKHEVSQMSNKFPMVSLKQEEGRAFYFRDTDYIHKGVALLHVLRMELGDELFFQGIKEFSGNRGEIKFVETKDFENAMEKVSGKNLEKLFAVFCTQARLPQLQVDVTPTKMNLHWKSEKKCELAVEIQIGSKITRVEMPGGDGEMEMSFGQEYEIDPEGKLVMEFPLEHYSFEMSEEEYLNFIIGQMILVGVQGDKVGEDPKLIEAIRDRKVGAVVLYEKNIPAKDSKVGFKALIDSLHAAASLLPLIVSIDQEGGRVNRLKTKYGFPPSVTASHLGQLNQTDSTYRHGLITARTLRELGINVNFAPVMDLCSYAENPIIAGVKRCYSDDPAVVADHGIATVKAHRKYHIGTSLKHFPGHGSSHSDTHLGIADVTNYWTEAELLPFKTLIDSGYCDAIMTAHIVNRNLSPDSLPATLSYKINHELLREKWGFQGLIFTDDMQMKAISKHYGLKESIYLSINSGVDILLFSNNISGVSERTVDEVHKLIRELMAEGRISRARIEESFWRIVKFKMGLIGEEF